MALYKNVKTKIKPRQFNKIKNANKKIMNKLIIAYIFGILSFVMAVTGVFSLFFSIPGLILGVMSLKMPEKKVIIPLGYQGRVGKKNITAQPFMTTKYLSYIAIGLNVFSMAVSLFATVVVAALFTAGTK
ncbi:MAG: hypothetical protein A2857_05985 [Candidatus Levybacteria bacterium RIFCSPHIGHO2_01_FULL_36_15]|nr:MAG: hypothetical protein A2857_05985 [Candidatus Levybacteria bacterium RIFCSPHIGHO2_01_FULL_36_15]OGH39216.1 MAG: hypothetical protein A2905_06530 [Candidatus Levybacteria bacterium RIFCSPLOWO2_01_FULL_36_10]